MKGNRLMRNNCKRALTLLLSMALIVTMMGLSTVAASAASKPTLAKASKTLYLGGTYKIKVKNAPKKAKITYKSSNKKIATVTSKGIIKGVKKGKCKVYAYAQNGVFKAVTVTVK